MAGKPGIEEIIGVAERLGIGITSTEAEVYQSHLVKFLDEFDEFLGSDLPEDPPPQYATARPAGYRPSEAEDPLNAWMWKTRIEGAGDGPLHGLTVSFKDHIAVAGTPTAYGLQALEGNIADYDATIVSRTLAAGGTVVGKNVMDGLGGGFGFGGGIGDFGRVLNPHDHSRLSGGSSSGSAAAVAVGDVDISFGGDQGGSIRIPASWSGTVGLKPTFGAVSHFGAGFGSDQSVDYVGPLTRTVRLAAVAFAAVAGRDGLDPRQTAATPECFDVLSALEGGVEGLRIGILTDGFADADPAVAASVSAAAEVLAGLGAEIVEVSVPAFAWASRAQTALMPEGARAVFDTGFFGAFTRTWYPSANIEAINRMWANDADGLDPRIKLNYLVADFSRRLYGGRVYAKSQNMRGQVIGEFDRVLTGVDALVMPTTLTTAPEYDAPAPGEALAVKLAGEIVGKAVRNTRPFNYTGHPALAVPCGMIGGLPASMQLVGRFFDEGTLLRIAYAFEQAKPDLQEELLASARATVTV